MKTFADAQYQPRATLAMKHAESERIRKDCEGVPVTVIPAGVSAHSSKQIFNHLPDKDTGFMGEGFTASKRAAARGGKS